MSKKILCIIFLIFLCMFAVCANAAEDLSDWDKQELSGVIELMPSGTSLSVNTSGTDTESGSGNINKYFEGATGMLATVNISKAEGTWVYVSLWKYVGTTSTGNLIQAAVFVVKTSGRHEIRYVVIERDQDNNLVKMLAKGDLGSDLWAEDQDVAVAFSRIENEIWFYTPENGAFVKVEPFEKMGDISTEYANCYIAAWTEDGPDNTISGTVSDVQILYLNQI